MVQSAQPLRYAARCRVVSGLSVILLLAFAPALPADEPQESAPASEPIRCAVFEAEKGPLLLGEATRADILKQFPDWEKEYADYLPDSTEVAKLARIEQPVAVLCVLGTWCSDSEREVPRFWKLLDEAANEHLTLRMLGVSRLSEAEAAAPLLAKLGFEEDIRAAFGIEYVPTFIFTVAGAELGRIIETPELTLEADAAAILFHDEPDDPDKPNRPGKPVQWH